MASAVCPSLLLADGTKPSADWLRVLINVQHLAIGLGINFATSCVSLAGWQKKGTLQVRGDDLRTRRPNGASAASKVANCDQLTQPSPSPVAALLRPAEVPVQTEEVEVLSYIDRPKWA